MYFTKIDLSIYGTRTCSEVFDEFTSMRICCSILENNNEKVEWSKLKSFLELVEARLLYESRCSSLSNGKFSKLSKAFFNSKVSIVLLVFLLLKHYQLCNTAEFLGNFLHKYTMLSIFDKYYI